MHSDGYNIDDRFRYTSVIYVCSPSSMKFGSELMIRLGPYDDSLDSHLLMIVWVLPDDSLGPAHR